MLSGVLSVLLLDNPSQTCHSTHRRRYDIVKTSWILLAAGHWWAWLGWKMGGGGSGLGREQGAWLGPRRRVSHAYGGDGKELRAWLASRVGWEVGQDGWGLGGALLGLAGVLAGGARGR